MHIYIYIYIDRERERGRVEREKERKRERKYEGNFVPRYYLSNEKKDKKIGMSRLPPNHFCVDITAKSSGAMNGTRHQDTSGTFREL